MVEAMAYMRADIGSMTLEQFLDDEKTGHIIPNLEWLASGKAANHILSDCNQLDGIRSTRGLAARVQSTSGERDV